MYLLEKKTHNLDLCYDFREETVHVIGFEVSEEELRDGLKESPSQR